MVESLHAASFGRRLVRFSRSHGHAIAAIMSTDDTDSGLKSSGGPTGRGPTGRDPTGRDTTSTTVYHQCSVATLGIIDSAVVARRISSRSGRTQRTIYVSAYLRPHRSQFVLGGGAGRLCASLLLAG
jgi:hypothetical protein